MWVCNPEVKQRFLSNTYGVRDSANVWVGFLESCALTGDKASEEITIANIRNNAIAIALVLLLERFKLFSLSFYFYGLSNSMGSLIKLCKISRIYSKN
jgi:hypothetical protein